MRLVVAIVVLSVAITNSHANDTLLGTFGKRAREIRDFSTSGTCEKKWGEFRQDISLQLDTRKKQIEEFIGTSAPNESTQFMKVGNFTFLKPGSIEASAWKSREVSWAIVSELYSEAGEDPKKWAQIQGLTSMLLYVDRQRWGGEVSFDIPKEKELELTGLLGRLNDCYSGFANSCVANEDLEFIRTIPTYYSWWHHIELSGDSVEEFDRLHQFAALVGRDWGLRYSFEKNPAIRRVGNTLVVPLKTADFAEIKPQLQELIEGYWKSPEISVRIEWDAPEAFELKLGEGYASDAITDVYKKVVTISNGVRLKTFVHEFGHILGFSDEYFVSWNEEKCEYSVESDNGNLMSDSFGGVPLKKHFDKLNEIYLPYSTAISSSTAPRRKNTFPESSTAN